MANEKLKGGGGGGGGGVFPAIPQDILCDVLTRIPVKSLMRFKWVPKLWFSTISDRNFSKVQRARSGFPGSLLMVYPENDRLYFFNTPLLYWDQSSSAVSLRASNFKLKLRVSLFEYDGFTEVINGLFCLYASNRASLCNISTLETIDLPFSGIEKVICTTECEILTLSKGKDASWSRFGAAPYKFWTKSLYVNGALYWKHPLQGEHGYEFVLIVFYLKDESFHKITPPIRAIGRENDILEFQGHLALVCTTGEDHNFHFWILEDIEGQSRSRSWTQIVITVPRDSIGRTCRYPAGSLSPTGEILMTDGVFKSGMHICSYDQTKQKVDKFVICKSLSLPPYNWKDWNRKQFGIYYYEETMTPLNKLFNNPVH